MRKAEFDSTSLKSAADSNHACHIRPVSNFNGNLNESPIETEWRHFEPKANRQKKIYHVLSSRNKECTNAQHFGDAPVEFLPDMLSSIQQYSNYHAGENTPPKHDKDVNALSLVYELMRKWDQVISVYESLSS